MKRVVVVGGGIAGLAAAHTLASEGLAEVTLLEGEPRLGGKIRTSTFAGLPVDEAADAFLARVPAGTALANAVGIADELVSPASGSAFVVHRGRLRPLPDGLVLGVPSSIRPLLRSRIVGPGGVARAALDQVLPGRPLRGDDTVGRLVRRRLGRQVHERLVDPMLGGINAGRTEDLSLAVAAPQLAAVAARDGSLLRGLQAQRRETPPDPSAPVFYAPIGGMERLVEAVTKTLHDMGADVRTGTPVSAIERRRDGGWSVDGIDCDGVVVAAPAPAAAALLRPLAPAAAEALAAIRYSSVVLTALAYRRGDVAHRLDGSGFLVPRREGRLLTACSWASTKWAHLGADPETVILRASVGRVDDERGLAMGDEELVATIHQELTPLLGLRDGPVDQRVSRWIRAFPQYPAGHLDAVERIEGTLARAAPRVALAGAALRGVGVPTCITSGQQAARLVTTR